MTDPSLTSRIVPAEVEGEGTLLDLMQHAAESLTKALQDSAAVAIRALHPAGAALSPESLARVASDYTLLMPDVDQVLLRHNGVALAAVVGPGGFGYAVFVASVQLTSDTVGGVKRVQVVVQRSPVRYLLERAPKKASAYGLMQRLVTREVAAPPQAASVSVDVEP